jgi:hypothetical protein
MDYYIPIVGGISTSVAAFGSWIIQRLRLKKMSSMSAVPTAGIAQEYVDKFDKVIKQNLLPTILISLVTLLSMAINHWTQDKPLAAKSAVWIVVMLYVIAFSLVYNGLSHSVSFLASTRKHHRKGKVTPEERAESKRTLRFGALVILTVITVIAPSIEQSLRDGQLALVFGVFRLI